MIYLDNSATTLKKPDCVKEAVWNAMEQMGNSGRGGYQTALSASRMIYQARMAVSEFFDLNHPSGVVFTSNATEALNTVIQGLFSKGDHVITTVLEHNSVLRPLYMEQERGVELSIIGVDEQADVLYEKLESAIKCNTKAVICTHGSNVTGNLVDIKRIGAVCRAHQLLFIVDASQSAGCIPISMKENQIDILCFTGHKGLMGPQGTGGICIRPQISIRPLKSGGTGVLSFLKEQPQELPEHLEAGTLNGHGIAGLLAAIGWLNQTTVEAVQEKEEKLLRLFYENAKECPACSSLCSGFGCDGCHDPDCLRQQRRTVLFRREWNGQRRSRFLDAGQQFQQHRQFDGIRQLVRHDCGKGNQDLAVCQRYGAGGVHEPDGRQQHCKPLPVRRQR